jgi:2,4-dienoyl-CoA reductase (NADPH2)
VVLFEQQSALGGQFNYARKIPGKEEFNETLRYYRVMLDKYAVEIRLNTAADAKTLAGFDDVVLATGVRPRAIDLPGIEKGVEEGRVLSYAQAIENPERVGRNVAIIGAGGIGFDVAELLVNQAATALDIDAWCREWGVDLGVHAPGGLQAPEPPRVPRNVVMLQRKTTKPGKGLGITTGWVHRATLKKHGVTMLAGCDYDKIDASGLYFHRDGLAEHLAVDTIVVCAGQESVRGLAAPLTARGVHVIGGADEATELDAKRAIEQGTRLAAAL